MKTISYTFSIVVSCFVSLIIIQSVKAADNFDPLQAQALELIADTAERICVSIEPEGYGNLTELSGEARAELSKVIKSLVDIGIEGAGKYQESKYQGPLREDLVEAIKASHQCKLSVFERLEEKLIVSRNDQSYREDDNNNIDQKKVYDPYNNEWKCEIIIRDMSGQQLAAGIISFGKVINEPKMSYANVRFTSKRTQRLAREITFDSGAWSLGYFGKCLEADCMGFSSNTEPYVPVFLVNKVTYDEAADKMNISGVVMTKQYGKHSPLGRLSGICK